MSSNSCDLDLFFEKYDSIIKQYQDSKFENFCLSYEKELQKIDEFEKRISQLRMATTDDDLEGRVKYIKDSLTLDDSDCNSMELFYIKLKNYLAVFLFNNQNLQELKMQNNEMVKLFNSCKRNNLDEEKMKLIHSVVTNKLASDVCLYTQYLVDNIESIYKFYIYIFDTLFYYDYELLSLELFGYIDEVVLFLSEIYEFYSLSKKSVLTYRLIVELERFRDYQLKKVKLLYEE